MTQYLNRARNQVEVITKHGVIYKPLEEGEEEIDNYYGYTIGSDSSGLITSSSFSMHTTYYVEIKPEKTYDAQWLVQDYYDRYFSK